MKLTRGQMITIIGCIITAISTFLPLASVTVLNATKNIPYIEGDGRFVLALAIVVAIFALRNKRPFLQFVISCICGVILMITLVYSYTNINSQLGEMANMVDYSYGLYTTIVGVAVMISGAIFQKREA